MKINTLRFSLFWDIQVGIKPWLYWLIGDGWTKTYGIGLTWFNLGMYLTWDNYKEEPWTGRQTFYKFIIGP